MPYARHETFYIRDGWLRKGLKLVKSRGYAFFREDEAPEVLGVGKNMVNSIRFWLRATGLLVMDEDRGYELSDLAEKILERDGYFEAEGTWWLIHYHLVTDAEEATTWFWFFNIFNRREFDEETFLYWLTNYTIVEGTPVAESSLKKDFQCFVNTYLSEKRMDKNGSPEDNLNCPLRELNILRQSGPKSYRVNLVDRRSLDPLIVYYAMVSRSEKSNDLGKTTISRLLHENSNIGKAFGLTYEDIIFYLDELQKQGLVTFSLTAGLDSVELGGTSSLAALDMYYSSALREDSPWTTE